MSIEQLVKRCEYMAPDDLEIIKKHMRSATNITIIKKDNLENLTLHT